MKGLLILIALVCATYSTANGQAVGQPCPRCSETQREQQNKERARLETADTIWLKRAKLPTAPAAQKPYYARTEIRFGLVNEAAKKIKQVTWECTLVHPETQAEIAKYTFVTRKNIAPYQEAILKETVEVPMNQYYGKVVPVGQAGKQTGELPPVVQAVQFNKVIEIKYADGSFSRPE
jgi:hypothetical protein